MASLQWEQQIRQSLDDLANPDDAKGNLKEILRSLTRDRKASEARISTAHKLENEVLQTGLLLDLINIRDAPWMPAKKPSETTNRIFRAIPGRVTAPLK